MIKKYLKPAAVILCAGMLMGTMGVQTRAESTTETVEAVMEGAAAEDPEDLSAAPKIEGLTCESKAPFQYATTIDVYYYSEGYKLISVHDDCDYLVIPEGKEAPEGLSDDVVRLQMPLDDIYMAATGSMALFNAAGALDHVKFSSLQADGWYVDAAKQAMEDGKISYAGKYSAPDYEQLLGNGCDLAVESTMILHSPDIKEMLENLGIPVFVDRSSYESHPLGRTEWIRAYAAMTDTEETADAFMAEQTKILDEMAGVEESGKTVAFFYVNTKGSVVARRTDDTVPKMIELA